MKRQKNNLCVKDLSKIGKTHTRSSSSNYGTCSDDQNQNLKKSNDDTVSDSTILSGQLPYDSKHVDIALGESLSSETAGSETSYSINFLDQNIDVLAEDDDVFLDCNDTTISGSNDSTAYIPIKLQSELSEVRSNNHFYDKYVKLNNLQLSTALNDKKNDLQKLSENKRFTTILEDTEIVHATNSFRKQNASSLENNRPGSMVMEVINKIKECDNLDKHSLKKVLFVNEDNVTDDVNYRNEKILKSPHLSRRKSQCCSVDKVMDENCNVHNTTESFVLWERLCKASETSESFVSECYGGDDEKSSTYKTLDDTFVSNCSIDMSEKSVSTRKFYRHRSKSCDSILREVRHLPHVVLDKFLKCLSEEIENIRKKNVVCTCKKSSKKSLYKENEKTSKRPPSTPVLQVENLASTVNNTNSKLKPKVLPYKEVNTGLRLSPRSVTNNPENVSRNQKSPKTPTNSSQKRGFYSWQKEIVSPVGEYIRGKRESPFKNSPTKRKL